MPNFIDITGNTYFYLTVLNLNREKVMKWDAYIGIVNVVRL